MGAGVLVNWLLALASAGLLILAFPRFDLSWLAPVALTPLLVAVARARRVAEGFLLGWAAGLVYWAGACYWIQFVLYHHGGLGVAASWAALLLFAVIKGLHLAVLGALAGILMRRLWAVVAVPALWVAIERTNGPLGFAWQALGNAGISMDVPMRLAPFVGVYGLSFVFAMLGSGLALVVMRRPREQLAPLLLLPALYLLPRLPEATRPTETALLVQPNISESAEWSPEWTERMYQRLESLSRRGVAEAGGREPGLVVWPEVPLPVYYYENAGFREVVTRVAIRTDAYLLLNVVAHTAQGAPLNSALLVDPQGRPVARYDKIFLVPIGEYVPRPFGFISRISGEVGDFVPGKEVVVLPAGQHRIGAFICYESVFPHLVRQFAAQGAELFVNISNDGWYGRTVARDQHLKIVRMRAAENRRWILRATNDGITASIDPAGRVVRHLPSYFEGAATAGYAWIAMQTPYTRYGDWFVLLCAVAAAVGLYPWRMRRTSPSLTM
jgi:apolipoprotein N-acyltransferase